MCEGTILYNILLIIGRTSTVGGLTTITIKKQTEKYYQQQCNHQATSFMMSPCGDHDHWSLYYIIRQAAITG